MAKKPAKPKRPLKRIKTANATDVEKREAYELWLKNKKNTSKTARDIGMSRETLKYWIEGVISAEAAASVEETDVAAGLTSPGTPVDILAKAERLAAMMLDAMGRKLGNVSLTKLGPRFHVLVQDILLLRGQPGSISRSETSAAAANFDFSQLSPDQLETMAKLLRRSMPGTGVKYASGVPVILEGVEDSESEPAAGTP